MATDELAQKLARRADINEGEEVPNAHRVQVFNPYTEFKEFTRKQIKEYEKKFKTYDIDGDNHINMMELKNMMEKLGAPQTHLGLKAMMKDADEDLDNMINFREFLLIFRKAETGELEQDSGLSQLAQLSEINVDEEGVGGAKNFFEAKIQQQTQENKFMQEILDEQEQKKREAEEAKIRRQQFKEKAAVFKQ
ncbi:EF-hand domain-containing protein D2-like [Diadema antillarum]|uniref:EF-hand domain-containing protein D2-like n=1 Tax=Diadema antillarum TaxID=105358 RepID=UPI003A851161